MENILTSNKKFMYKGLKILGWTAVCVGFALLFGYITMILWNWLVPTLFHGPVINFWHALGLLLLSKILFGGFGGGKHCHTGYGSAHWKHRYNQKLSAMSPEDRERFKARMTEKWCSRDKSTSSGNSDTSNV
jgi:hypothetical protein